MPAKLLNYGAPGMTRTCDLLVRSQTLYPTELRALISMTYAKPEPGRRLAMVVSAATQTTAQIQATIFRIASQRGFPGID
jgi:hypothetical protein